MNNYDFFYKPKHLNCTKCNQTNNMEYPINGHISVKANCMNDAIDKVYEHIDNHYSHYNPYPYEYCNLSRPFRCRKSSKPFTFCRTEYNDKCCGKRKNCQFKKNNPNDFWDLYINIDNL